MPEYRVGATWVTAPVFNSEAVVFDYTVAGFDREASGFDWEAPGMDRVAPVFDWRHFGPAVAPPRALAAAAASLALASPPLGEAQGESRRARHRASTLGHLEYRGEGWGGERVVTGRRPLAAWNTVGRGGGWGGGGWMSVSSPSVNPWPPGIPGGEARGESRQARHRAPRLGMPWGGEGGGMRVY